MKLALPVFLILLSAAAHAHFSFVTPLAGGTQAEMFLSETLQPDGGVNARLLHNTELKLRDSSGKDTPLTLSPGVNSYRMALSGSGVRTIHGVADLGLSAAGPAKKPYLLLYYPKAIYGVPFGVKPVGGAAVAELVPEGASGNTSLLYLVKGQPHPDAEVTVLMPDGAQRVVRTDASGRTPAFTQPGRYGAWARYWEPAQGVRGGKPYEQFRHYATLVFDALPSAGSVSSLPEASASLGAVAADGFLYVYGGHTARTHSYSTAAVSGRFHRMNLTTRQWEELPGGPALQGMNLAAWQGQIYRVGGMEPRNQPGEKADNHSIATVASYDPASRRWRDLPPLPEPRSSHDLAVIGSNLYVTAGWTMKGAAASVWASKTLVLNLAQPEAGWREIPQPFQRRALITAVHRGRLFVIAGMQPDNRVSLEVDVFDPATGAWSKGPSLPGPEGNGFATAAAVHGGSLYVSLGNGSLLRLDGGAGRWVECGASSPRLAHRMVATPSGLLIAGGADKGKNSAKVEEFPLPPRLLP